MSFQHPNLRYGTQKAKFSFLTSALFPLPFFSFALSDTTLSYYLTRLYLVFYDVVLPSAHPVL